MLTETFILYEFSMMKDGTKPTGAYVHDNLTMDGIKSVFYSVVSSKYANEDVVSAVVKVFDIVGNEILHETILKEITTEVKK